MAPGRIRVFIAGDVHVKRAVVRRFLEDDGYEVVGEALTREHLAATIRKSEPDAVVIDEELLAGARGTMARIRRAVPDAKIIVFTSTPVAGASPAGGADGYVEKGVGLAALTSLLVHLFTDEPVPAGVAAGADRTTQVAASAAAAGATDRTPTNGGAPSPAGAIARLVTVASGAVLIVWGLIAMIATNGVAPPPADTTDTTRPGTTVVASNALEDAYGALDRLVDALEEGNYVLATVQAQTLLDERGQAIEAGFAIGGLDAAITQQLGGIVAGLPQRVNTALTELLGRLYPTLPEEEEPGGGSGVVFGPTTGSGVFTGGNGGATGGQDDVGRDGTGGGGDDGGEEPGGAVALGPGDGRAWGQSHKADQTSTGHGPAPGGGPPPWANGNANGQNRQRNH